MEHQNSSGEERISDQKSKPQRSTSPDPSCVSMKSFQSITEPPELSKGGDPSCVSMKSDQSIAVPPELSKGGDPSCVSMKSDQSIAVPPELSKGGDPSCVSMKSDQSIAVPPELSKGGDPSCVSMKSDQSIAVPPELSKGGDSSCVSMKSDQSMHKPLGFISRSVPSDPEWRMDDQLQGQSNCGLGLHLLTDPVSIPCGHSFCRQCISRFWDRSPSGDFVCPQCRNISRTRPVLHPHKVSMEQGSHQPADDVLHRISKRHRTILKNRYESLFEGIRTPENKTLLNSVYTQLYIIEGESERVNEEHEVLQMEKTPRKLQQDAPIHCSDIFKPLQGPDGGVKAEDLRLRDRKEDKGAEKQEIRRVLTKGIAGIGKTVSVQKFILDWAEGKANQEVDLMFVLPFRELNLIKDDQYSLHGLLCAFHPELRDLDPEIYDQLRAVFIFDGLDESRLPLDFEQCEEVSDITMTSSVGVLMTNLIRGDLLPSALIWITSRPAAANKIPPRYIHRVTEIQGFTDPQKEEYFRKRIKDKDQAQKIISHIKTAKSLHIMCHIPVFCWISATVLQRIITQSHTEIPTTLTEMYSHFLLTQINMKKEKYEEKEERDPEKLLESNRTELLKLAELAFTQLLKGNVMFYEEDLRESSINVTKASVYCGIFTEIFREECVIHQRKVYCFVHLSFQEFLAAVFVFHCYENNNIEPLQSFISWYREESEVVSLDDLLCGAVDKAVESQNGHLDLFLRFLLGLSLESNHRFLQGLLTHTHRRPERTMRHLKELIRQFDDPISTERSINLFLCLSEMKDQSLYREIEEFLNSEKHSEMKLSPGLCLALTNSLLTSEEELKGLDLSKLIPVVTVCRNARLCGCEVTKGCCKALDSGLQSVISLKELDLSNSDLQDSGVELLSAGLESPLSKLETLRLAGSSLGDKDCKALRSFLQSNSSLKELDLSNNDLQDSGMELLSAELKSPHCKLETLRLSGCMITDEGCCSLASALKSNPSHLRELDLSYNNPGESGVKLFSDLLQDPHCALEKLQVEHQGNNWMKSGLKKYYCDLTLDPNTAHPHLTLSEGKVENVGEDQSYPDHPERFDHHPQVLSVESLTGRCYWEVEWSGRSEVDISVSYRGISRKGGGAESVFGHNKFSWSLICSGNSYWVRHNDKQTKIPDLPSHSDRVGVYLDWGSGTLSFCTISLDTHTHTNLHTFSSTFTEPLYAGFRVVHGSSVRLCEIK